MSRISRRTALRWIAGAGAVVLTPVGGLLSWLWVESTRSNVGALNFRNRLHIPPLLKPAATSGLKEKHFHLTLQQGKTELIPGKWTTTWGANGSYLGPTIAVRRGDRVTVKVSNELSETTTLHWHGMHLPARADGGPHQPVSPGATWAPSWTIDQPAATLWYHPHLHRRTAEHVYRGIAGLFLVEDENSERLPHEYGVDDIPLVIQDKKIRADGSLDTSGMTFSGVTLTGLLGDKILVNGTYDPFVEVTSELTRFRLLNASNARVYDVGFIDKRAFWLVATDNGLLDEPIALNHVPLSPGERAEIVVAFRPGEQVIMRSFPPRLKTNFLFEKLTGGSDTFDLVKIKAAPGLRRSPPLPKRLAEVPAIDPLRASETVQMKMGDFTLNGMTMDPKRIDHIAAAGSVEVWELHNVQDIPHNFHMHGVTFHVLPAGGRPLALHQRGNKDTVYVPPNTKVRLAVQFREYSDPRRPYMFHCHFLAHEDAGMMGQFLVVSPKDRDRVPAELQPMHHPFA